MSKVFISYRHGKPDEEYALQLCTFLEGTGFDVFIDRRIRAGQKWVEEIGRNLRSSDHFVVLLSADGRAAQKVDQTPLGK